MNNKAFTLIELLIVISIISLLSTVVMYSTSEAKLKAEDAHMKVESNQVATAVRLYKDNHGGKAPVSASYRNIIQNEGSIMISENDPIEARKNAYTDSMQILVDEGYLPEIPTSPDASSYSYLVSANEKDAVFAASLKVTSLSSNSNSCEVVDTSKTYGNCSSLGYTYEIVNGQQVATLGTCSDVNYDSGQYECILATISSVESNCDCVNYNFSGDNENYPDGICTNFPQFTNYGVCRASGSDTSYLCEYSGENSVCSGSSNSDYCSCI